MNKIPKKINKIELKVLDIHSGYEGQLSLLKNMHHHVLKKDNWWHFFYEGDYITIRYSNYLDKIMFNYMKRKQKLYIDGMTWEIPNYKDNIKITRKYQLEFTYIFHGFSEIAIKTLSNFQDAREVLERINHCFINTISSHNVKNLIMFEPDLISHIARDHAFNKGYLFGLSKAKEQWAEEQ